MSGLEGGAAVFSLVVGVIEIIHRAIEIYEAVNDKSGIPKTLKKVSEKLPSVEEILKSAETQYKAGDLKNIDKDTWADAERDVEKCKQACQELHDLLQSAYPKADSGRSERLWQGAKTVLSGKGKTAEALLKEISDYLTLLAQRNIVKNAALLEEIKSLVEELCPEGTTSHMHNVNGDNIGALHGNKNVNSGSGNQFTGAGGTYNFGGAHSEETQYSLLSLRHRDHRAFSGEGSKILRDWISHSNEQSQSLTVSESSRVKFEKIYRRISDDDPMAMYRRSAARKAANTTEWLGDHEDFKSWLSGDVSSKRRLWLSGKVGCGKSTLTTTVIDHCRANRKFDDPSAVLFFFFQNHEDTALSLFESLTKQVIAALVCIDLPCSPAILAALEEAYGNDISRPEIAQVCNELLLPMCGLLQEITLVIDGIDECRAAEMTLVWQWLDKLLERVHPRVLITSEDQANVASHLNRFCRVRIDQEHNQIDIDTYIEGQIARKAGPGQVFCDRSLREEVQRRLQQKADGMFLWIHLVLRIILEYCETPAQVRQAVGELPPDLETVYLLCLEKRRDISKPLKAELFIWVCAAPRPLSFDAVRELLAMDLETGQVDGDEMPFVDGLLKSGAGLITLYANANSELDVEQRFMVPIHSTVRDFVFSRRFHSLLYQMKVRKRGSLYTKADQRAEHASVAGESQQRSWSVLVRTNLQPTRGSLTPTGNREPEPWPLCVEAFQWTEGTFRSALGSLCLSHIRRQASWKVETRSKATSVPVYPPKIPWFIPSILVGGSSKPVKVTADLSVLRWDRTKMPAEEFLRYAIENWLICNRDLPSSSAVFPWLPKKHFWDVRATENLFEEVAKQRNHIYGIHPWYAVAKSVNSHIWHMFAYAVVNNHVPLMQVVKRNRRDLPEMVFDLPLPEHDQMLAIHVAAKKGFAPMIRELATICNVNAVCPTTGKHALHFIADAGNADCLLPFLAMNHVNWNARDSEGRTALALALLAGHNSIVRALLKTGKVQVGEKNRIRDGSSQYASDQATYDGCEKVLQLLLKTGSDWIESGDVDSRALQALAADYGYISLLQLLLKTGKDNINKMDLAGRTPLGWAAYHGHGDVVSLFLDTEHAEIDIPDRKRCTPLWVAASRGHDKAVQLLLETGKVEIAKADEDGRTPLWTAAQNGHEIVVQLLLETGKAEIHAADNRGMSPLSSAASQGHDKVVQLLLGAGAHVNKKDEDGQTALWYAADKGHGKVVELLLGTGKADCNSACLLGRTPLFLAATNGHHRVVELLLTTGNAEINAENQHRETLLQLAAARGHAKVVQLLLETGKAGVNVADREGNTALLRAASRGHYQVVQLLLETDQVELAAANNEGQTALDYARLYHHAKVVQLLLDAGQAGTDTASNDGVTRWQALQARADAERDQARLREEEQALRFAEEEKAQREREEALREEMEDREARRETKLNRPTRWQRLLRGQPLTELPVRDQAEVEEWKEQQEQLELAEREAREREVRAEARPREARREEAMREQRAGEKELQQEMANSMFDASGRSDEEGSDETLGMAAPQHFL